MKFEKIPPTYSSVESTLYYFHTSLFSLTTGFLKEQKKKKSTPKLSSYVDNTLKVFAGQHFGSLYLYVCLFTYLKYLCTMLL